MTRARLRACACVLSLGVAPGAELDSCGELAYPLGADEVARHSPALGNCSLSQGAELPGDLGERRCAAVSLAEADMVVLPRYTGARCSWPTFAELDAGTREGSLHTSSKIAYAFQRLQHHRDFRGKPLLSPFPYIMHQTWKSDILPSNFAHWRESCVRLHSSWKHKLWTDQDLREFVAKYYPTFFSFFDNYPDEQSIKRIDIVRYLWMHRFGGVYIDLDFECLRPLDGVVKARAMSADIILGWMSNDHTWEHSIPNALLISRPGLDFWLFVVDEIMSRARSSASSAPPSYSTGSVVLYESVLKYPGSNRIQVLPSEAFYPVSWATCERKGLCRAASGASVIPREEVLRRFPEAFAATYWSHSWTRHVAPFPRLLHQTWKTRSLPENFGYWRETCLSLHSTWEHKLWTDDDNRDFVATHYKSFLHVYDSFPLNIMRVDAVRYLWMHHFGGVYADLDFECLRPFDGLLREYEDTHDILVGGMGSDKSFDQSIPNALIISRPGLSFWLFLLEEMRLRANTGELYPSPDTLTGPALLRHCVLAYVGDDRLAVLAPERLYPVNWASAEGQRLRLAEAGGRRLPREEALRRFPGAFAVTYWSHTWGPLPLREDAAGGAGGGAGGAAGAGAGAGAPNASAASPGFFGGWRRVKRLARRAARRGAGAA